MTCTGSSIVVIDGMSMLTVVLAVGCGSSVLDESDANDAHSVARSADERFDIVPPHS